MKSYAPPEPMADVILPDVEVDNCDEEPHPVADDVLPSVVDNCDEEPNPVADDVLPSVVDNCDEEPHPVADDSDALPSTVDNRDKELPHAGGDALLSTVDTVLNAMEAWTLPGNLIEDDMDIDMEFVSPTQPTFLNFDSNLESHLFGPATREHLVLPIVLPQTGPIEDPIVVKRPTLEPPSPPPTQNVVRSSEPAADNFADNFANDLGCEPSTPPQTQKTEAHRPAARVEELPAPLQPSPRDVEQVDAASPNCGPNSPSHSSRSDNPPDSPSPQSPPRARYRTRPTVPVRGILQMAAPAPASAPIAAAPATAKQPKPRNARPCRVTGVNNLRPFPNVFRPEKCVSLASKRKETVQYATQRERLMAEREARKRRFRPGSTSP